ncbi:uncharacterized protein LOC122276990 isoform X2 [Carya illinoinensis]|uniref:uncharacterized protein LOC122276990 isoform X2 n=1 Tax=Carya illinoinensis TaxID=32201 RepID=UPI001C71A568|nr:uncharacterized protein LOC122276990 isoform X2 [Carya illinoinensis]
MKRTCTVITTQPHKCVGVPSGKKTVWNSDRTAALVRLELRLLLRPNEGNIAGKAASEDCHPLFDRNSTWLYWCLVEFHSSSECPCGLIGVSEVQKVPAPAEEKRIAACLIGELILYLMTSLAKKDLLRPFESLCAFYDQEDQRKKEEKNKEIANIMSDGMMKKDLYYSTIKRSHVKSLSG